MVNERALKIGFVFEAHICKLEGPMPPAQAKIERKLLSVLREWLDELYPLVEAWALEKLRLSRSPYVTEKAWAGPPEPLDSDEDRLYRKILGILREGFESGGVQAAFTAGVEASDLYSRALVYAEGRAAELVGRHNVGGVLVENPDAKWRISDSLREQVSETVQQAISEGWSPQDLTAELRNSFDPWRAETIARTETAFAYGNGAIESFRQSEVEYLVISDGEGCLPEGHDDKSLRVSDPEPGVIYDEMQADGQIWTVDQYAEYVIGHPNCIRAASMWIKSESRGGIEGPELDT